MPRYRYTAAQFVGLLREMSEQDRAHVDERAGRNLDPRYMEHGKPCCLVAHLMLAAGVSEKSLKALDQEMVGTSRGSGSVQLPASRHPFWRRFEPAARQLLEFVQLLQDHGQSWGVAADEALEPERPRGFLGQRWVRQHPGGRSWLAETA